MSDLTGQIKSLLNDEALRQALTKESLQEMLTELDSNEIIIKDQESTIEALNDNEKSLNKSLTNLRGRCGDVEKKLAELKARITNLDEREKTCALTEIRNEFELRRGDEFKELMHATVKNTTFKRKVMGGLDIVSEDGYNDETTGQWIQPPGKSITHGDTEITDTKE